eukprot:scaffold17616_cov99-Isochrysis_galbana.AAC.3
MAQPEGRIPTEFNRPERGAGSGWAQPHPRSSGRVVVVDTRTAPQPNARPQSARRAAEAGREVAEATGCHCLCEAASPPASPPDSETGLVYCGHRKGELRAT